MKFTVVGGDMRIVALCRQLRSDGHEVSAYALDMGDIGTAQHCRSLEQAIIDTDCIILPLPLAGVRGYLASPMSTHECTLEEVFSKLPNDIPVCVGMADGDSKELAQKYKIQMTDYFLREELCILNAVATAEGALAMLINETDTTLLGRNALIIGNGRIGKCLAERLRNMGVNVAVSSRKYEDMAWCRASGLEALDTENLLGKISKFDMIINTVPAVVFDENHLKELKNDVLCMDLASKPGGIDFSAAAQLGVKVIWALGIPAKVAPTTAGEIIKDTIYNILTEQELL